MSDNQKHGFPALLSFFLPGLGQLIKGDIFKAIGIWIALIVSAVLTGFIIGFVTGFLIWLWQVYDAYNN